MADGVSDIFENRKANTEKLVKFGFWREGRCYVYKTVLTDSGFKMHVTVNDAGEVRTQVYDPAFDEPYSLHLVEGASGGFVGGVRSQYEDVLREIAERCFDPNVFKTAQAKELIAYVRDRFGDELEYLWKKFPKNAVWRRNDNAKWYGAILSVQKNRLGFDSTEIVEIIDLRIRPELMQETVAKEHFYPGWHMNKKHWYTVLLDGSVSTDELCRRIDESYRLAKQG